MKKWSQGLGGTLHGPRYKYKSHYTIYTKNMYRIHLENTVQELLRDEAK